MMIIVDILTMMGLKVIQHSQRLQKGVPHIDYVATSLKLKGDCVIKTTIIIILLYILCIYICQHTKPFG